LAAVLASWSCDHLDLRLSSDLLRSEVIREELARLADGGLLVAGRLVCGGGEQDDGLRSVLDRRLGALMP
jgi:hypothetical protein